jgi:hypothetical protein
MMLLRLPILLKENECKLLIKYDGERKKNKYTVKLLYNDLKRGSLGKDTDNPFAELKAVFKNDVSFSDNEITFLFFNTVNKLIECVRAKLGDASIISVIMEENDENIMYTLHIQAESYSKHCTTQNIQELFEIC